ncbi:MAG: PTS sugar transporter subunit IIB [Anaerolineaceae bacterium]|nr:PTS sugar transporter subunit IIB [Anaerolineaceae bacterium]
MGISLIRCDERLIHGQCITGVLRDFQIQYIILVDEDTCSNPIFKRIYEMAVPANVKIDVTGVSNSYALIQSALRSSINTLLLLKDLSGLNSIHQNVPDLPKELNVGPMSNRKGTTKITYFTYLNQKELEVIEQLSKDGFKVYFQQTLNQKPILWNAIQNEIIKK